MERGNAKVDKKTNTKKKTLNGKEREKQIKRHNKQRKNKGEGEEK